MSLFHRMPFDKKQIESAITQLEQNTSAELRVYIERNIPNKNDDAFSRGLMLFEQLEMHKTQLRNGILIYIAYKDQQCAIIGDNEIHRYVGSEFWQIQCQTMMSFFKQQKFTLGVVHTIAALGRKLIEHFPIQDDDVNELPNEVIIHD